MEFTLARPSFLVLSLCVVTACGGGGSSGSPPPTQITLKSIAVAPPTLALGAGGTAQLTVTGTYSDGSMKPLPATGETFTSSNTRTYLKIA